MTVPKIVGPDGHGRDSEIEANETTRLLQGRDEGDGAGADAGGAGEADVWDGYKDFEGLPWWRRPSVSYLCHETPLSTQALTAYYLGVLADGSLHRIHARLWRCHGSQTQLVSDMFPTKVVVSALQRNLD